MCSELQAILVWLVGYASIPHLFHFHTMGKNWCCLLSLLLKQHLHCYRVYIKGHGDDWRSCWWKTKQNETKQYVSNRGLEKSTLQWMNYEVYLYLRIRKGTWTAASIREEKKTFERGEREAEREFLRTAGSNLATRDSNSKPRLDEFARNLWISWIKKWGNNTIYLLNSSLLWVLE